MNNKDIQFFAIIAVSLLTFFGGLIYSMHVRNLAETKMLSETIKFALEKGIEPLAVTCALDKQSTPLCIMYVNKTRQTGDISVQVTKK